LIADVPLGAFLSGGVDSSSVVALMAAELGSGVQTFTIGFDDQDGFDERPYAARVAKLFATDHHEFVVKPDAVELIERLVWAHDQPFGDSSAIPTYLLSEVTRQHVTVALCGDGGDELFAGYERFAAGVVVSRLGRIPQPAVSLADAVMAQVPDRLGHGRARSVRRLLARASAPMPDAYRGFISYIPDEWVDQLTRPGDDWSREDYRRIWQESAGASRLDRLQLLNIRTYLLDDLLPKVDRSSMATALEVRAPFLDHELTELALRLRPSLRMRGLDGKRVLKHAMADLLPRDLLYRRKRGFGVPLDRWFRQDLVPFVDAMLLSPDARVRAHLDTDAVSALLAAHTGGQNHGHALWTLLTLEVFLRKQGW
jgi:asparagine synthase (glutamine-hydrolysing)